MRRYWGLLVLVAVPVLVEAQWTLTSPMHHARAWHAAVPMSPNTILVVGEDEGGTASAEIYDRANAGWTVTGSLNQMRMGGVAVRLTTGSLAEKVLVICGYYFDGYMILPRMGAELYDPATGSWTVIGSLQEGRFGCTATELTSGPDAGKVLVVGGESQGYGIPAYYTKSVELFDPATGASTWTSPLTTERGYHTATRLTSAPYAGKVLVAGGYNNLSGGVSSAELYDPVSGTWTQSTLNAARTNHTATKLRSGKIMVAGGTGAPAELYDPATNSWALTGALNVVRSDHTATLLESGPNSGKVLVAGGWGPGGVAGGAVPSAELYDPDTGVWTQTFPLNVERANHTATWLTSGVVVVTGGYSSNTVVASAELY